jgi:hypothetical protein
MSRSSSIRLENLERRMFLSASPAQVVDPPASGPVQIYAPHSTVRGKTIGEWSANWWQWALSFSAPNDPFTDPSGVNADLHQSGPVYFVGAPGGVSQGAFTVPGNKPILIALVNGELSQLEIGFDKTAAQVKQAAADQADLIDSLHASIDGAPLSSASLFAHREVSPAFHFVAAPDNPIGVPAGDSGIAFADGYYLMLAPLGPGQHVINFGGTVSSFGFSIDATYTLTSAHGSGHLGGSPAKPDDQNDSKLWDD